MRLTVGAHTERTCPVTYPPPAPPTAYREDAPLWAPLYDASFGQAFRRFWMKYADFTGRASRSEYWWWMLAMAVISLVLEAVLFAVVIPTMNASADGSTAISPGFVFGFILVLAWSLGAFIPSLALLWRRLHDAGFSGAWWLLAFIPFGSIVVLVFTFLPSNPAGARFDRPRP